MKGETVTLKMDANLPAQYYLTIKKPDGSNWASATGTSLRLSQRRIRSNRNLHSRTYGLILRDTRDTTSFAVTPDTYDVTISLVGLPPDATTALLVDGNKAPEMKGGDVKVLTYPIGTSHTFQVDQYVSGASGYRYYCEANSVDYRRGRVKAFEYKTQVLLRCEH